MLRELYSPKYTLKRSKTPKNITINFFSPESAFTYQNNRNNNPKSTYGASTGEQTTSVVLTRAPCNVYTPKGNTNYQNFQNKTHKSIRSSNIKEIAKQNQRSFMKSIDASAPLEENKTDNIKNLESMINEIKSQGFEKYEKEYQEKMKIKTKLENSIEALKKKIMLYNNDSRGVKKDFSKDKLKIQNMRSVSVRYQEIAKGISDYQKEIPTYKPQIEKLKAETIYINSIILNEKRELEIVKDEVAKMNKLISDKEKEKDNFRPAMILLKKHINALKLKIKNVDMQKSEFMINVTEFARKKTNINK